MKASECTCGKILALSREICPRCGKAMTPIELGNDAILLTHTTLHTVPEGFIAPIFWALVELEQGAKLLCECKNEANLEIGRKGKIIIEDEKHYFMGSEGK